MWIDDAALNLEVTGEPDAEHTVLMVHGAGGCAALWRDLAGRLAPKCRAAALDLSGHGESPPKGNQHTLETYAADVNAAANALGGSVVICGHSMGGALAMYTALENPGIVRDLVLTNTGARLRVMPQIIAQLESDFQQAVPNTAGFAFAPNADKEITQRYTDLLMQAAPRVVVQDFRICDAFDVMDRLGQINCPVLIVSGDSDNLTPAKYAEFMQQSIPGSKLHPLSGCGHMSMLEAPDALAGAILDFLESRDESPAHPTREGETPEQT